MYDVAARSKKHYSPSMNRGFSLVELSIVLVILGLLTGGILSGQALIRGSELRASISEFQRHSSAIYAFRDKYFGLPGDIRNATAFWGRLSATACTTNSAAAITSNGVCDGDANGRLSHTATSSEAFQFWRQLANSGLVEGSYSGLPGSGGIYDGQPGINDPASKLSSASWYIDYFDNTAHSHAYGFDLNYGNAFRFGADIDSGAASNPILKPEEAWNIDIKLDDGKPAQGNIIALYWNNECSAANTGVTAATNFDAIYRLTDATIRCALIYKTNL